MPRVRRDDSWGEEIYAALSIQLAQIWWLTNYHRHRLGIFSQPASSGAINSGEFPAE
jgi:hypothetical protein